MAKKVVAGLRKATGLVKVIKPVKIENGKYRFKEEIVAKERVNDFIKN